MGVGVAGGRWRRPARVRDCYLTLSWTFAVAMLHHRQGHITRKKKGGMEKNHAPF